MIAILVVSPWAVTGQDQPFPDGEVKLLDGVLASRMTKLQAPSPASDLPITQVIFVHGINAGCDAIDNYDKQSDGYPYRGLYDALIGQGLGAYTFCYDHDLG